MGISNWNPFEFHNILQEDVECLQSYSQRLPWLSLQSCARLLKSSLSSLMSFNELNETYSQVRVHMISAQDIFWFQHKISYATLKRQAYNNAEMCLFSTLVMKCLHVILSPGDIHSQVCKGTSLFGYLQTSLNYGRLVMNSVYSKSNCPSNCLPTTLLAPELRCVWRWLQVALMRLPLSGRAPALPLEDPKFNSQPL